MLNSQYSLLLKHPSLKCLLKVYVFSPYMGELTLTMFALSWSLPRSLESLCVWAHPWRDTARREEKGLVPYAPANADPAAQQLWSKDLCQRSFGFFTEPHSGQGGGILLTNQLGKVSIEVFSSLRNCDSFYLGQINWVQVVGAFQLTSFNAHRAHSKSWETCSAFQGGALSHSLLCRSFCGCCYKYFVRAKIWKLEDRSWSFRTRILCHYSVVGLWWQFHSIPVAAVSVDFFYPFLPRSHDFWLKLVVNTT